MLFLLMVYFVCLFRYQLFQIFIFRLFHFIFLIHIELVFYLDDRLKNNFIVLYYMLCKMKALKELLHRNELPFQDQHLLLFVFYQCILETDYILKIIKVLLYQLHIFYEALLPFKMYNPFISSNQLSLFADFYLLSLFLYHNIF